MSAPGGEGEGADDAGENRRTGEGTSCVCACVCVCVLLRVPLSEPVRVHSGSSSGCGAMRARRARGHPKSSDPPPPLGRRGRARRAPGGVQRPRRFDLALSLSRLNGEQAHKRERQRQRRHAKVHTHTHNPPPQLKLLSSASQAPRAARPSSDRRPAHVGPARLELVKEEHVLFPHPLPQDRVEEAALGGGDAGQVLVVSSACQPERREEEGKAGRTCSSRAQTWPSSARARSQPPW